jgi:SecD/SecF fusion protein
MREGGGVTLSLLMRRCLAWAAAGFFLLAGVASGWAAGMEFLLEIGVTPGEPAVTPANATKAFEKRLKRFGFKDYQVKAMGGNLVAIQIFDAMSDQKEVLLRRLTKSATLEFRLVLPESRELLAQDIMPPSHEKLSEVRVTSDGRTNVSDYLVGKKPAGGLTERHIAKAVAETDSMTGRPQLAFTLTPEGTRMFAEVTTENVGRQLAIILNKKLISAPVIREPITGGRGQISGEFTLEEIRDLAALLEAPLEFPVTVIQERAVDSNDLAAFQRRSSLKMALLAVGGFAGVVLVVGCAILILRRFV